MAGLVEFKIGTSDIVLGGVNLGHTKGGTEVTPTPTIHEKKVDKYGEAPVGAVDLGTRVEIKTFLAESSLPNMAKAIAGATLTAGATKDDIGIGKTAGGAIEEQTLVIHPVAMGTDVSEDWNFHKVVPIGAPTFAYKVDEDRVFEVTFLAIIDESQADGERLVRIGTSD